MEDNIKTCLREMGYEHVNWMQVTQDWCYILVVLELEALNVDSVKIAQHYRYKKMF
jgi:hypothetical protein